MKAEAGETNPYAERDIGAIRELNTKAHLWFAASVPGAIGLIQQLTSGVLAENFIHHRMEPNESILLGLGFALWWVPFELSEYAISHMKEKIRSHLAYSGETESPISYSPIIRGVNTVMKIAHDRTPLP